MICRSSGCTAWLSAASSAWNTRGMMQPRLVDGAEHGGDAGRRLAAPVGTGQQVEAGLRAVHRADLAEGVGPLIGGLEDEEALAEIGHLDDHGSRERSSTPKP